MFIEYGKYRTYRLEKILFYKWKAKDSAYLSRYKICYQIDCRLH